MEKSSASLVIRQMQINTLWILKSQNSHHEKSKGQQMLAGVQRKRPFVLLVQIWGSVWTFPKEPKQNYYGIQLDHC